MTGSHQYLTADDLGKIKRVLADAHMPNGTLGMGHEAARFLMRKYQEGMTDEAALAEALDLYVGRRNSWRLMDDGGAEKH